MCTHDLVIVVETKKESASNWTDRLGEALL